MGAEYKDGATGYIGKLTGKEIVTIGQNLNFGNGGNTSAIKELVMVSEKNEERTKLANESIRIKPINPNIVSYENEHRTTDIVEKFRKM